MTSKAGLRRELKKKLSSIDATSKVQVSLKVCESLNILLKTLVVEKNIRGSFVLGVYSPLPDEVNWQLLRKVSPTFFSTLITSYPSFVHNNDMVFRECPSEAELIKSSEFGPMMKTPNKDCAIVVPKICLVPGLGLNRIGHRLGRGAGFYDRYLASHDVLSIGMSLGELLSKEELPIEKHDMCLDYVIGPEGVYSDGKLIKLNTLS